MERGRFAPERVRSDECRGRANARPVAAATRTESERTHQKGGLWGLPPRVFVPVKRATTPQASLGCPSSSIRRKEPRPHDPRGDRDRQGVISILQHEKDQVLFAGSGRVRSALILLIVVLIAQAPSLSATSAVLADDAGSGRDAPAIRTVDPIVLAPLVVYGGIGATDLNDPWITERDTYRFDARFGGVARVGLDFRYDAALACADLVEVNGWGNYGGWEYVETVCPLVFPAHYTVTRTVTPWTEYWVTMYAAGPYQLAFAVNATAPDPSFVPRECGLPAAAGGIVAC